MFSCVTHNIFNKQTENKQSLILFVILLLNLTLYGNRVLADLATNNIRVLSKLAYREEFEGDTEHRTAAYSSVREDSSTGSTYKLPLEVEFGKNSNIKIKDYGTRGHVFPIIEKSLLEIIKEKLAKIEQEGNLEKLQEIFRNKVRQKIANPIEVSNITIATENSSRFYDPIIVQKEAIKDHRGKIIVEAGTKINPLDKIEWGQALIFIDGKNPDQIVWAKSKLGKLTLIKGSPIDLSKELNRPIYFDQGGALVKRFNIKAVPAIITQEGKLLKIMEVAL